MKTHASKAVETVAELREQMGWTYRRIAEHLGCSPGAVAWVCLVNGIEKPGPATHASTMRPGSVAMRKGHPVRTFTPEEDARLLAMEAEGLSNSAIGRALGSRPNSIRGRLATLARIEERAAA